MARLISTKITQHIDDVIRTNLSSGSYIEEIIKKDDIVEGLRYVEDSEVKSITGRVDDIIYTAKYTNVNLKKPADYFASDVKSQYIVVDASEEYKSNLVSVNSREVVEHEGVEDVVSVFVTTLPSVDLEMAYSDETVVKNTVKVGDVIKNAVIMTAPGKPDITGDFKVAAFAYRNKITSGKSSVSIYGMYLVPMSNSYSSNIVVNFENIISFEVIETKTVSASDSLGEVAALLEEADEVSVKLGVDVTIPRRDDGRITSLFINPGKTLDIDLNGHSIDCAAYAFYVNGGTLNISDSTGKGAIKCDFPDKAYPAIMITTGGVCNMYSGKIDTTGVEGVNWLYGAVCSGNGIFNMYGGEMLMGGAAGISITNGTASGEGATFNICGDSVIRSLDCSAIYLADNKKVNIYGNAKIYGGIAARLGDINVYENAYVEGSSEAASIDAGLTAFVVYSGCDKCAAGILALTGVYRSDLGNDLNVNVSGKAKVVAKYGKAIQVAMINTLYDQTVKVNVDSSASLRNSYKVYTHDELAEIVESQGKTMKPEASETDLTIIIDKKTVYPKVD